jgi:hypothetical protein
MLGEWWKTYPDSLDRNCDSTVRLCALVYLIPNMCGEVGRSYWGSKSHDHIHWRIVLILDGHHEHQSGSHDHEKFDMTILRSRGEVGRRLRDFCSRELLFQPHLIG